MQTELNFKLESCNVNVIIIILEAAELSTLGTATDAVSVFSHKIINLILSYRPTCLCAIWLMRNRIGIDLWRQISSSGDNIIRKLSSPLSSLIHLVFQLSDWAPW